MISNAVTTYNDSREVYNTRGLLIVETRLITVAAELSEKGKKYLLPFSWRNGKAVYGKRMIPAKSFLGEKYFNQVWDSLWDKKTSQ
jgi:hypothetical protein